MPSDSIGSVIGIDDIQLDQEDSKNSVFVDGDQSGALWEYHEQGTINGVPVQDSDKGLAVDAVGDLQRCFVLRSEPCAEVLRIAPNDAEGLARYNELLKQRANGSIVIEEESKHFDAATSAFVVWIQYSKVYYALHPRFAFMRQDI